MLVAALDAAVTILTGSSTPVGVPPDFFGRLTKDLHAAERQVVADLSGPRPTRSPRSPARS